MSTHLLSLRFVPLSCRLILTDRNFSQEITELPAQIHNYYSHKLSSDQELILTLLYELHVIVYSVQTQTLDQIYSLREPFQRGASSQADFDAPGVRSSDFFYFSSYFLRLISTDLKSF